MRRLLVLLVTFLLVFSVTAASAPKPPPWRTVALAHSQSQDYSYTSLGGGVIVFHVSAVRLRVQATADVRIDGSVYCNKQSGTKALALRQFGYRATQPSTYYRLPLPLARATCNYFVAGVLKGAGSLTLTLQARP